MKIAYLVVAHRNPGLLEREIRALSSQDADFFLHIDSKSNIQPFSHLAGDKVIFLQQRYKVHWAGFSIVRAVLELIRTALCGPQCYDFFILLGGSEYPLQSKEYIHGFLSNHSEVEFIDMVKLPNLAAGKPISHIEKYCVESRNPLLKIAVKAAGRAGLRRDYRRHLKAISPWGGEMWWALTRGACEYVCGFCESRPDVVKFFQNVQVPDETFIQTILGNSEFAERRRRNLLFRDWSGGGAHPALIGEQHIAYFGQTDRVIQTDAFGSGEVLFARKFTDERLDLVEQMETMIAQRQVLSPSSSILT